MIDTRATLHAPTLDERFAALERNPDELVRLDEAAETYQELVGVTSWVTRARWPRTCHAHSLPGTTSTWALRSAHWHLSSFQPTRQ